MTIQLEFNFLSDYAFSACEDLYIFAVSFASLSTVTEALRAKHFAHYYKLQCQAIDLKSYAFVNDYISGDDFEFLTNSVLESSTLFWGY